MQEQIIFSQMREDHLDGAARVLTRSFLELNQIWKAHMPKYQEVFPLIRGKILPSVKGGCQVALQGKKIVGVSIQYDLVEYLKNPSMPTGLELFRIIGETGKNLDKKIDYSGIKTGVVNYGLYGVIDPEAVGNQYAIKFWWFQFAMAKVAGWTYYYSRISSPVSLMILQKMGAQILAQVDVVGSQGKHKMSMIQIDLRKPFPSYTKMLALFRSKKPKAKPKL